MGTGTVSLGNDVHFVAVEEPQTFEIAALLLSSACFFWAAVMILRNEWRRR